MSPADPRDPLGLAADAPLLAAYLDALDRLGAGEHPFFTPGHKGLTDLTGVVVTGDLSLAGWVDTIKFKHRWLAKAEERAARLFGADVCRFSVAGSTHGNQALALAVGAPGDTIVVSRTVHRSVLLGLVLAGLVPAWVQPDIDRSTGLPSGYAPERVREVLREHPEAVGVFLGDPSYVGTHSDIAAHAEVAHEAGVSASTLTRMGQGKRPDLDTLGALATWSGLTVDDFVVGKLAKIETEPLTRMTALLRTDRNLTSEGAATLEAILKTAYEHLRKTPE